jgi:hypothetical protein
MEQNWEIKMKLGEKQNGINCIVWFALILGLKKYINAISGLLIFCCLHFGSCFEQWLSGWYLEA